MWQNVGMTKDLDFSVPRLVEGNQYFFQVSAENECGTGPATELDNFVVPKSQFGKFGEYIMFDDNYYKINIYKASVSLQIQKALIL